VERDGAAEQGPREDVSERARRSRLVDRRGARADMSRVIMDSMKWLAPLVTGPHGRSAEATCRRHK
jgi:hypothetical protein